MDAHVSKDDSERSGLPVRGHSELVRPLLVVHVVLNDRELCGNLPLQRPVYMCAYFVHKRA